MPFRIGPHEDGAASAAQAQDAYIAALLREREGYIARGLADRVAAVEAALVAAGMELVERAVQEDPQTERAVARRSRKE